MKETFEVVEDCAGQRLDYYLASFTSLSRTRIQKLIEDKNVLLNEEPVRSSHKLKSGDRIEIELPPPEDPAAVAEEIPLDIIYEDKDIIVINKPRGIVVHPAAGVKSGTIVNAFLFHCKDLSGIGGVLRPGIVHRLDKDTSGVLVAAKNDEAHSSLVSQFSERQVNKEYIVLVHGNFPHEKLIIELPIGRSPHDRKKMAVVRGGRAAKTEIEVMERFKDYTLLKAKLYTGRTHQIRVHLTSAGYPVVGDTTYGRRSNPFGFKGQALHSHLLGFSHPRTGKYMEFKAPLPEEFEELLRRLKP